MIFVILFVMKVSNKQLVYLVWACYNCVYMLPQCAHSIVSLVLECEDCSSLIYSNLALSLTDMRLEFFSIHPLMSNTSWTWCVNNMVGDPLN